jgi:hypothetical protein
MKGNKILCRVAPKEWMLILQKKRGYNLIWKPNKNYMLLKILYFLN